ncbi:fungal-specific transcription factor domain-containing protein [Xylariaceae sp. FL0016]|nr:fungal-specific transcription factor domain-containing protein [Xylariaceae sp. FL0016]
MEAKPHPQRKACDLCYRRKIKCDGQQQGTISCSTCVLHKSECTYKATSRKTPLRKQVTIERRQKENDLQSRVDHLESQLRTVLEKVEVLEKNQQITKSEKLVYREEDHGIINQASGLPDLPPSEEVIPIIERYVATFNSIMPLFHPPTLSQTVRSWYHDPHSRKPVAWALINVVLALAHHTGDLSGLTLKGEAAMYLSNAQSVLTEITMGETHLANIQVLLGMVLLFWSAEDLDPALILVGTALRLVHKLGLNMRRSSMYCSPAMALQRTRVFWIAYVLDRDISLAAGQAPVQLDDDIDLDLPPLENDEDLAGFIFSPNGQTTMNYFRARVELAKIQGHVYGCVYSASAQKLDPKERMRNAVHIVNMLDDWTSHIPPDFQASILAHSRCPELSKYFCILYAARLSCRALLSFGSPSDSFHYSEWMSQLQDYGGKVVSGHSHTHAPVPNGWHALTDASREFMKLYATVTLPDTFFTRMTLCAYNSSLIALMANRVFNPLDPSIRTDKELMRLAMETLEDLAEKTDIEKYRGPRDILRRLCSYADWISSQSTASKQVSGATHADVVEVLDDQHFQSDVFFPETETGFEWEPLLFDEGT